MNYEVRFFAAREFRCPCCGGGEVSAALVLWLDLLRSAWGSPLCVNSGWRCLKHNREVGGSDRSRHMIGCAVDVAVREGEWLDFAPLAARMCRLPGWEFRLYDRFIHIAVPRAESKRLWQGGEISC